MFFFFFEFILVDLFFLFSLFLQEKSKSFLEQMLAGLKVVAFPDFRFVRHDESKYIFLIFFCKNFTIFSVNIKVQFSKYSIYSH